MQDSPSQEEDEARQEHQVGPAAASRAPGPGTSSWEQGFPPVGGGAAPPAKPGLEPPSPAGAGCTLCPLPLRPLRLSYTVVVSTPRLCEEKIHRDATSQLPNQVALAATILENYFP